MPDIDGRPARTRTPVVLGPLVLLRHGTSRANLDRRIAGWQDSPLAPEGEADARLAAGLIRSAGLSIDTVYVSRLDRARRTGEIVAAILGVPHTQVRSTWRLNERHAGAFEGMTRDEMTDRFGRDAVRTWKHGSDVRPVPLAPDDPRHPAHDPRYDDVPRELLPSGESAGDVLARVLPFWTSEIHDELAHGRTVLIVTHDRVLRVLVDHLGTGSPTPSPFADRTGPGRRPWAVTLRAVDRRLAGCVELGPDR